MLIDAKRHVDLLDQAFQRLDAPPLDDGDRRLWIALLAVDFSAEAGDSTVVRGIANQTRVYAQGLSECVSCGTNADPNYIAFCIERLRRSVADLKGALEQCDRSAAGRDASPRHLAIG
jgi:hypothetical protein